jgi:uncharacterized protein YkwD
MLKTIFRFTLIIALGLAVYFYQTSHNIRELVPAQTGQVGDSVEVRKEVSLPEPLKVSKELLSQDINSVTLSNSGIIKYTNIERLNVSKVPLVENIDLVKSAKVKLDDMFKQQYFEHVSPKGTTLEDLAVGAGYEYILIGENLAEGDFKDDHALVSAWMTSPKHKENILNDRYTQIGVAVGHGILNGQDVWLGVQHFGRPLNLCPAIDQQLVTSIDQVKARIDTLGYELNLKDGEVSVANYLKDYNKVKEYNNLVKEVQDLISTYNTQVATFNLCIQN